MPEISSQLWNTLRDVNISACLSIAKALMTLLGTQKNLCLRLDNTQNFARNSLYRLELITPSPSVFAPVPLPVHAISRLSQS